MYPKQEKYTKIPQNRSNGLKIYQRLPFCKTLLNLPKFRFFGLKIYHLATLRRFFESIISRVQEFKASKADIWVKKFHS
jgi:hypothetical protein